MKSLGFGLERLGLVALRHPRATAGAVLGAALICALGFLRIEASGVLSDFFRSDNPAYKNYIAMSERFPTSEFDVFVIVEGEELLTRERLEDVRTLHLELQFVPAVNGVLSMFSMREAPDEKGYPAPMFPSDLPEGEEFDALVKRAVEHPLLQGKLLTVPERGSPLTVLIVSLKRDAVASEGLGASIREIKTLAQEILIPGGLRVHLAGAPVMQQELRDAVQRDRLLFNATGFVVGFFIALLFFQRLALVIIASLCAAISVVWSVGTLGLLGIELNSLINTIPPLVMVIAFSDAMHMIFTIRRRVDEGDDRFAAVKYAIAEIGPACALTSLTTAFAMLSLTYADSGLIRTFGVSAAFATMSAFVAVILIVPSLTVLLLGDEEEFRRTEATRHWFLTRLDRFCVWLASGVRRFHIIISVFGIVLTAGLLILHLQLEPRYRLSDQIPQDREAMAGTARLDQKLTGAQPVHVMIRWPEGMDLFSPQVLAAIEHTHKIMERADRIGNVWSLFTLRRWLREGGPEVEKYLQPYLKQLPEHLTQRFINESKRGALVTGRIANLDASDTVPIVRALEKSLEGVRAQFPGFSFSVTGLPVVAALRSDEMINQLNYGLLLAIIVVVGMIGLAFRSWEIAALSVVPNLFPLVATGALLYLMGGGLEYAGVIALTVAFGLAVDDTIHLLNRLRIERLRIQAEGKAVSQSVARVGPVLILTTVVLVLGLAITVLSAVPPTQMFGRLAMTMLAAALIGDLILLPALVLSLREISLLGRRVEDDDMVSL